MALFKNLGKWRQYKGNLVKVLDKDAGIIIYGVPIETGVRLTKFLPYTSYRGLFKEDYLFEWVNYGEPHSIVTDDISQMEVVPKTYVDDIIKSYGQQAKLNESKRRLEHISIDLELPKMEEAYRKMHRDKK